MKAMSLSKKVVFISTSLLILVAASSTAILYNAQKKLATEQMDTLLKSESFSLASLVNVKQDNGLDFEITSFFLSEYKKNRSNAFFRVFAEDGVHLIKQTDNAPVLECNPNTPFRDFDSAQTKYRVASYPFQPELDDDVKNPAIVHAPWLCLVVGLDQAPYDRMVKHNMVSTLPLLVIIMLIFFILITSLVLKITDDLSRLAQALSTADFKVAYAFPKLPHTQTPEVKSVIEKLAAIHDQATQAYQEMWLFLGRAAHQLKTPAAALQATIDVLLRKERTQDELVSGLEDVRHGVQEMSALTKKLLASSRVSFDTQAPNEIIDLDSFVQGQIKLFQTQAALKQITLREQTGSPSSIRSKRFLLGEILGNLIENAIMYSPQNTTVTISWTSTVAGISITFEDQGKGMPPAVQENLFKPFVRGDERSASGSGLGLSISKKSAQILGGDLILIKSDASGTSLMLKLPQ